MRIGWSGNLARKLLIGGLGISLALLGLVLSLCVPTAQARIEVESRSRIDARLVELQLRTPNVEGPTGVRVLLPRGYERTKRSYPVLYLLHGAIGSYRSWTELGDAEALTADKPLIVVMPDSGTHDGYTDWYNGGDGGPPAWERYHVGELIPFIDRRFRTTGDRAGRAVAGLSMGGGGAMAYAARHPDLFTAAASFSGAVRLGHPAIVAIADPQARGDYVTQQLRWRADDPVRLAANLRSLELTLRTGNGLPGGPLDDSIVPDVVEAVVHQANLALHERLQALGIDHLWDDYGPGNHTWPYWQRGLAETLPGLMRRFKERVPAPAKFSYKSAEPGYRMFGWKVSIRRRADEFSNLGRAGRMGFTLAGSGRATVRTAALFRPCRRFALRISDAGGKRRILRRAGRRGRLTVPVDLGPSNRFRQFTPEDVAAGHRRVTARVKIKPRRAAGCRASRGGNRG